MSCQLKQVFNISCSLEHILDLDSTTIDKFSRHLIYHLEGSAFRNNIVVGHFVRYICDRLRALKDLDMPTTEYKDVIHLNRQGRACSCPSGTYTIYAHIIMYVYLHVHVYYTVISFQVYANVLKFPSTFIFFICSCRTFATVCEHL